MKKNVASQEVRFSLFKAGARIANPTIAVGDFKRDLDGAGQNNVTTPPTSDAAGLVTWVPSAAETNADCVTLLCLDALGAEWEPLTLVFYTEDSTSIAAILDDTGTAGVLVGATQGAITWAQQKIVANVAGQGALDLINANATGYGQQNYGGAAGQRNTGEYGQENNGSLIGQYNLGQGMMIPNPVGQVNRGAMGQQNTGLVDYGVQVTGVVAGAQMSGSGANSDGVQMVGTGTGAGANIDGGATGYGVDIRAAGNNGLQVEGGGGGSYGAEFLGGAIGVRMEGTTDYGAQFVGGIAPTDPSFAQLVWTYATRTLTSVAGVVGAIALAVWTYVTRTLTSVSSAPGVGLTAQTWRVLRGDTLSRTFATIAADPTLTKCQVTVKHKDTDADTAAVLAVDSTTGLLRLNGAAPGAFTATFVVATGVLTVPAATMARIDRHTFDYDVQVWVGAVVTTIEQGTFEVTNDITATVTP